MASTVETWRQPRCRISRRICRSNYQVIYRLDEDAKALFVLAVAHRSEVYRQR